MSGAGTTLEDLLAMLRVKRRRLPFEIGAFLALQVAESLLLRPRRANPRNIVVAEDGKVDIVDAEPGDEAVAIASLVAALTALLAAAGEGVPPMLLRLVEPSRDASAGSLARFRDELEASLVPLNRSAAERVLSRTLRDIRREASADARAPSTAADADLELDALISGAAAPAREAPVVIVPGAEEARPSTRPPADGPQKRSIFRDAEFDPEFDRLQERAGHEGPRVRTIIVAVAVILAALGGVMLLTRQRGAVEPRPASATRSVRANPTEVARGEIVVELETEGAVARLFAGRLPTLVDDVPVGVAQEIVALSDDGSFVRATVPADASYREIDGLPELAIELRGDPERGHDAIGTTGLRADAMGRASGRLGRIRVTAGPEGARVYRTVGFAPLISLRGWPVERRAELLVSAPGFVTRRVVVTSADFHSEAGEMRATVRVALSPTN